ncbi:hypothetical protein L6164_024847 [Bauhinia variegata]|uniref:Uncharacterized protein n=1 Tax=Bauhinia variegata TaxID=167791 RepID=A0ACB9LYI5_BAUVA|nr:hypothetical protein L6164_024847 [Bauhinia variegata]
MQGEDSGNGGCGWDTDESILSRGRVNLSLVFGLKRSGFASRMTEIPLMNSYVMESKLRGWQGVRIERSYSLSLPPQGFWRYLRLALGRLN